MAVEGGWSILELRCTVSNSYCFNGYVLWKLLSDKDAYKQFLLSLDQVQIKKNVSWNAAFCNLSSLWSNYFRIFEHWFAIVWYTILLDLGFHFLLGRIMLVWGDNLFKELNEFEMIRREEEERTYNTSESERSMEWNLKPFSWYLTELNQEENPYTPALVGANAHSYSVFSWQPNNKVLFLLLLLLLRTIV